MGSQISCGLDKAGCPVSQSVKDILVDKHPPAREAVPDSLLSSDNVDVPFDFVCFYHLTGDMVKLAAFHTHGVSGPSGVDAYSWHRLCSSFGCASVSLCNSFAAVA